MIENGTDVFGFENRYVSKEWQWVIMFFICQDPEE